MSETVSFIVPTIGRPSLARALESIRAQMRDGDEVLVCGPAGVDVPVWCRHLPCPNAPGKWGGPERRLGISRATGDYLAFLDDDDVYLPGARDAMADAAATTPGRPVIFRMRSGTTGLVIWQDLRAFAFWKGTNLRNGNIGSPMFFIPNNPAKLGRWTDRYYGDFQFINTSKWPKYERYMKCASGRRPNFCEHKEDSVCRCRATTGETSQADPEPCSTWTQSLVFRTDLIAEFRPR